MHVIQYKMVVAIWFCAYNYIKKIELMQSQDSCTETFHISKIKLKR